MNVIFDIGLKFGVACAFGAMNYVAIRYLNRKVAGAMCFLFATLAMFYMLLRSN